LSPLGVAESNSLEHLSDILTVHSQAMRCLANRGRSSRPPFIAAFARLRAPSDRR
jgi:hypothetical protein